tara:strand:+ start:150 stop:470 length:321 start_codon:yes stop_codon:yes gene_type:complete
MTKDELVKEMKSEIPKQIHKWTPIIPFVKSYLRSAYSIMMEKLTLTPEEKTAQKINQAVMLKVIDALPNLLTDDRFIEAAAEFAGKVEAMSKPQLENTEDEFELPN